MYVMKYDYIYLPFHLQPSLDPSQHAPFQLQVSLRGGNPIKLASTAHRYMTVGLSSGEWESYQLPHLKKE